MLTRLYFKNWRSLREEVEIKDLTPITVLIGANSSGKSNIVDGFHFLRRIVDFGIYDLLYGNLRDTHNPVMNIKADPEEDVVVSFSFKPALNDEILTYTLTNIGKSELEAGEFSRSGFVYRELLADQSGNRWLTNDGRTLEAINPNPSVKDFAKITQKTSGLDSRLGLSIFGGLDQLPPIQKTFNFIHNDRWQLLKAEFLPKARLSSPISAGSSWSAFDIAADAANMLAMLTYMQTNRADLYDELQSDFSWLLDYVSKFAINHDGAELQLDLYEPSHGGRPAPTISTGTARLLAMLTAYYALDMRNAEQPGLVVIEEPDSAIHPLLLGNLVDLLRSYTERTGHPRQFILTTHNPQMLNYFEPDEVRIVERDNDGATTVKRVNEKVAEAWRQQGGDFNLGSLWTTRLIGGVPR